MKTLLILFILTSVIFAENFRRVASTEVVIDSKRFLMWQDNSDVIEVRKKHTQSIEHCDSLDFAGYDDWYLPTIEEFKTIVDKKNEKSSINSAFKYNLPEGYWASDKLWRTFNFYAHYMNFISGTPYYFNRDYTKLVRCVRKMK